MADEVIVDPVNDMVTLLGSATTVNPDGAVYSDKLFFNHDSNSVKIEFASKSVVSIDGLKKKSDI